MYACVCVCVRVCVTECRSGTRPIEQREKRILRKKFRFLSLSFSFFLFPLVLTGLRNNVASHTHTHTRTHTHTHTHTPSAPMRRCPQNNDAKRFFLLLLPFPFFIPLHRCLCSPGALCFSTADADPLCSTIHSSAGVKDATLMSPLLAFSLSLFLSLSLSPFLSLSLPFSRSLGRSTALRPVLIRQPTFCATAFAPRRSGRGSRPFDTAIPSLSLSSAVRHPLLTLHVSACLASASP